METLSVGPINGRSGKHNLILHHLTELIELLYNFSLVHSFITSISSLRGAAHHLVGEANLRTNKPLKVPPLEERVPRPALMKQMEELLKKRQSMRMKSTDQDLNQDSSMFSYSFETHSATESSIQPEGSGAGLRKLDAEDDYYQIHLHNQNKIKQFAKMLNQAGGALESDAQIVEKANINPNSAPVAFKYDPTKRRSTSAGKKRASVSQPGGASPQRKQSTLSPMRRVSNALQPDGSPGANTGSTRLSIRSSVLQQRGSISQPPTLNASSSAVLSPLKEERNAVGRKLSTVVDLQNPSPGKRQLTNQRTSVLRKSSTLATLHESENPKPTTAPSSRPTSGRPSSAKPMTISRPSSAHLPSPQGNAKKSIIVANSNNAPVRASMISAPQSLGMEKSALTASTGSEVFDTNAGGAMDGAQIKAVLSATVGRKSGFDQRKTINNTNAKKKMSVTQPLKGESIFSLQSDSVPHPIAAGVTMPAVKEEQRPKSRPSKIIDREALSKEGTQSRKVSRLPAMKDAITTEAGGVISTQKMTKRRP